jgi:hypothetical protein
LANEVVSEKIKIESNARNRWLEASVFGRIPVRPAFATAPTAEPYEGHPLEINLTPASTF